MKMKMILPVLVCIGSLVGGAAELQPDQIRNEFMTVYRHYLSERAKPENKNCLHPILLEGSIQSISREALGSKQNAFSEGSLPDMINRLEDVEVISFFYYSLIEELRKKTYSLQKQQEVVNFLLKQKTVFDRQMKNNRIDPPLVELSFFLGTFYSPQCFNEESRKLLKKIVMADQGRKGTFLLLFDAAKMYDDPEVIDFLLANAKKCQIWGRNYQWFSLLLLARIKHEGMVEKLLQVAQKNCPMPERKTQIWEMPMELSLVRDRRVVSVLIEMLKSNEGYPFSDPFYKSLPHAAAIGLNSMIKGFPEWRDTRHNQNDQERAKCLKWLEQNPNYQFTPADHFSQVVKNIIW